MATLREVKNRIVGVKKTQKITKAMKMVAAARLRRAQNDVIAARPYARKLAELLRHLLEQAPENNDPLIIGREVKKVAIVAVTSDRGLCGGFNANVCRMVQHMIATTYAEQAAKGGVTLYCVGKKGVDFFGRRAYDLSGRYAGIFQHLTFGAAQDITRAVLEGYRNGAFDRVDIVYNEFKSTSTQKLTVEQFLPILPEEKTTSKTPRVNYIYEPSREALLETLLPRHLNFHLWRTFLESYAAEQGARMTAMENATKNADELIDALQLQYNKARQASITKELLEVVAGAEALRQAG
jgi:F-type H+-transporting ATPase subunit gamma